MRRIGRTALLGALAIACACGGDGDVAFTPGEGGAGGADANGSGSGEGGGLTDVSAAAGTGGGVGGQGNGVCGSELTGTVRDFQASHPDFEYVVSVDPGIVATDLGDDGKPVYAGAPDTTTTTGKDNFDQWYRNVDGVNQALPLTLSLTEGAGGIYTYENNSFFPIDGSGFGNEGNPHNYHFTFELRTKFVYGGGEVFSFLGDDDLWVFINGKLGIDLGGVHGALPGQIDLDAQAAQLGISQGGVYSLDLFFAERHTTQSNFRIDTTIVFIDCGDPEVR